MVQIDELRGETADDTVTLKWREPESNGKVITMYTVYQRVVTDGKVGQWIVKKENQRCFCERIENSVGERKGVSVCHYCN